MISIRPADPARDALACAAIYDPFVAGTAVSFEEAPPGAQAMATRIEGILATHPWLVAEAAGQVAGYAYASRHRERSAYRWAAEVGIYVAEGSRGQGVGRTLYQALLGELERRGFHVALAGITLPNPASVALHETLGFRHVGTYEEIGWKLGAWRDVGWWQRRLRPPGKPV